ncbi:MAG: hypothetical protein HUK22_04040 [Thermoguttaceae bacterium]|nr:hypothetical protein [Thermoguttaceae bacterium]
MKFYPSGRAPVENSGPRRVFIVAPARPVEVQAERPTLRDALTKGWTISPGLALLLAFGGLLLLLFLVAVVVLGLFCFERWFVM